MWTNTKSIFDDIDAVVQAPGDSTAYSNCLPVAALPVQTTHPFNYQVQQHCEKYRIFLDFSQKTCNEIYYHVSIEVH